MLFLRPGLTPGDLAGFHGVYEEDLVARWPTLLAVSRFVHGFCNKRANESLQILINPDDLQSFRIASMAASFCQDKNQLANIVNFRQEALEPLYGPPINETSLSVLFSVVDYTVTNHEPPNFEEIQAYHFRNIRTLDNPDPEKVSKAWTGKEDSRYVAALYASLRMLERRRLIVRKFLGPKRRIISITPTENGILSVVFSDLLSIENEPTHKDEEPDEDPAVEGEWAS